LNILVLCTTLHLAGTINSLFMGKQRRKIYVLSTYFKENDQNKGIAEAYYSGGYSQRPIGEYLGYHYSTVSQKLKKHEQQLKT